MPLSAPARQLLSEIREEQASKRRPLGEYVFPEHWRHWPRRGAQAAWRNVCKAAAISGLRLHDLRHSFASQLASGGASLPLIGALLGHSIRPRHIATLTCLMIRSGPRPRKWARSSVPPGSRPKRR